MREELAKLTGVDREVIDKLFNEFLIDGQAASRYIVRNEFKEIKKAQPKRSNADIYFELSEKHRVSESTVYKWVTNYTQF